MNTANVRERNLFERRYLMKVAIVQSVSALRGSSIANIEEMISYIDRVCEAGIIDNQVLGRLEIVLEGGPTDKTGYFLAEIDWARHAVHLKNGDRHVYLEISGEMELRHIADAIHQLADLMKGSCHYLQWTESRLFVDWDVAASPSQVSFVFSSANLQNLTLQDTQKLKALQTLVRAEVTPDKIDELSLAFSVVTYPRPTGFATMFSELQRKLEAITGLK